MKKEYAPIFKNHTLEEEELSDRKQMKEAFKAITAEFWELKTILIPRV